MQQALIGTREKKLTVTHKLLHQITSQLQRLAAMGVLDAPKRCASFSQYCRGNPI